MLFKEFVEINPKVELETGKTYPYVGMADVNPSRGYVVNSETREYNSSRSKFEEGDTLFARITPCLENGKIARFKSNGIKKGFGSTEFFVFRAKKDTSDPNYVYYLSRSPLIRKTAEKSMAGASGRQRADISAIEEIEISPPDLNIQKKIASILSAFDDLIENNTRRIEILEEMARRIYREWFVHFRYPGHDDPSTSSGQRLVDSGTELGEIPEGWEVKKLADVADINPENISTDYKGEIEYINISGVNEGSIDETEIHDFEEAPGRAKRRVKHGDIIWSSVRPNLKAYALILNPPANQIASTGFAVIRPKKLPATFLYNFSTTEYFVQYLVNHTRGSAYPAVNVSDFKNAPIVVPDEDLVEKFDEITWSNYLQINKLSRKNKKLKETRDLLLPKLISGKIDVEEMKLAI